MMNHKRNISFIMFYFLIMLLCFREVFVLMQINIDLPAYAIFVLLFFLYYLFDTINFKLNFKNRILLYCSILNFVAFLIVYFFFNKNRNVLFAFVMYNITQVVINYLFHDNTRQHINTLVIDDGNNLKKLKCILRRSPHYKFVGYLSDNEEADLDPEHIGKIADVRETVDDYSIEHIIFTKNELTKKHADLLMRVKLEGTPMVDYFAFLERAEGKVDVDEIDSVWVVMTDSFNRTGSLLQRKFKNSIYNLIENINN